jgi:hypothetical protein
MAMTYTWKIMSMKVKNSNVHNLSDVIIQTYWQKTGTDENGNEGVFTGATPFDLNSVNPNNFIPLSEITEEQVLEWVKGIVINDYERHVNERIQQQIEDKINVTTEIKEPSLPWMTANT